MHSPTPEHSPITVEKIDLSPRGPVFPSPLDWRDTVIYQLMIDRFDDERDRPAYSSSTPHSPHDVRTGLTFQGGTFNGITRRLDYIRDLGANTVWISPPLKNRPGDEKSYHGYGIQNFLATDPHFGTLADLQNMVRTAHSKNMYVIMDIVIDHVADAWAYEKDELHRWNDGEQFPFGYWRKGFSNDALSGKPQIDDAVWPIEFQRVNAYKRMGRMRDLNTVAGVEATDGDFEDFKCLDLENPAVLEAMIRVYKYWIATTDVDGFRIDAFRHIRPEAAARFCHAIREYAISIGKHNFFLMGELTGGNANMIRVVGLNTPLPEEGRHAHYPHLDAALDFELHKYLAPVLLGRKAPIELHGRYEFLARYYRDFQSVGKNYVTFVENHDFGATWRARLLAEENDPRLAILAATYLLTSLGIPCWYYGTEQAFNGGGNNEDVEIRECMFGGKWGAFNTTGVQFFDETNPVFLAFQTLAKMRAAHPTLRYGRQYIRPISDDGMRFNFSDAPPRTLAFSRILDEQEIIIAMNLSKTAREDSVLIDSDLSPPGTAFHDLLANSKPIRSKQFSYGTCAKISLSPRTASIFIRTS